MKLKNIIIIIISVALVFLAGIFFLSYRNSIVNTPQKAIQSSQPSTISVKDVKITDTTKPFTIHVTYPQIVGMDDVNAKLLAIVTKEISDFKTASLANGKIFQESDPQDYAKYPPAYDLEISYTKGQIDQNIVSVVFNVYNFQGGANGANYFIPFNYDVKNKKIIALADLFPGQSNYLQTISNYCIEDLTTQITKGAGSTQGTWIEEGAGPQADNYSVFLINTNSIVFYFAQTQVAPASYGEYQVAMPRPASQ